MRANLVKNIIDMDLEMGLWFGPTNMIFSMDVEIWS